jgi:hypothetical protein
MRMQNQMYSSARSALHFASEYGWESAVAKLLSLGADAALKDKVRTCSYMNTCMYSVHVCMFVNVLLIRTQAFWHMRIQNQMYRTWMIYA